jgi:hypothetical protein
MLQLFQYVRLKSRDVVAPLCEQRLAIVFKTNRKHIHDVYVYRGPDLTYRISKALYLIGALKCLD